MPTHQDFVREIKQLVQKRIGQQVRGLEVRVKEDGDVALVGKCKTYYVKQLAQEAALPLVSTHALQNLICVDR